MSVKDDEIMSSHSPVDALAGGSESAAGPSDGESGEPLPQTVRPLDRKALAILLVQHFSNSWGLRTAEFAVYLFLVTLFPDTLLPASIYGFVTTGIAIFLSGWAGQLVDEHHNLGIVRVSIIVIKFSACAQYGSSLILLYRLGDTITATTRPWSTPLASGLFSLVILAGCVHTLAGTTISVAVEREWVTTIAGACSAHLTTLNTYMRRIDLFCKLAAPLFVSLLTTAASYRFAAIFLCGVEAACLAFELIWITISYKGFPVLLEAQTRKEAARRERSRALHHTPASNHSDRPLPSMVWRKSLTRVKEGFVDWREFAQYPVFLSSLAISWLYLTVLSFDGTMLSYFKAHAYSDPFLAGMRSLNVVAGLAGTLAMPFLEKKLGLVRAGNWSIWSEALSLLPVVIALTALQNSLQNVAEMLKYILTMVLSEPSQFKWAALASYISIIAGGVTYLAALHSAKPPAATPDPPVQITTLSNGIRVATETTPGHFSSVGLMAFKTTKSRTEEEMANDIDALGGQILCSSARESVMYQSSHFHQGTPLAMSLIADTVLNPAFLPEEIAAQREAARYELREVSSKPEMILPEVLHHVAYGGQSLGNPLLCPEDRIDQIDAPMMRKVMESWYRPERMVIAGAGMPHDALVELADKHFAHLKGADVAKPRAETRPSQQVPINLLQSSGQSSPSFLKSLTRSASSYLYSPEKDASSSLPPTGPASYTGGHRFVYDPNTEFNHVYLAFEGVGIHDDDVYAVATMQVLLGGGGSFSAGGPGKGMYSRLYTHILNHFPQIDHCASFHHIYTDSSLFGLFASFIPASGRQANTPAHILPHLVHQLSLLLYSNIPEQELSRAKNQLKSSLMMALESRAVEVEDLGRQVLVHGHKIAVSEMCEKIDAVDSATLRRVAARLFGPHSAAKASVVVMGWEDIGDYRGVLRKYGLAEA
ncbi:transporter [Ganoderma sinense ZZ0214-1]|uniref:Transporter n=1 Tax=Ganoderma sinense ZZ0214-1 TaxID=1077348 RepID=A0A2G8SCA5_9APHY|nr:transporter [Ganoderma sinense ZZ0214-1]